MSSKLSIGIVGLPNVGKSTLFNAITNSAVEAQNYPFCTIEPNVGIVPIPDSRLAVLSSISGSEKLLPATITFVDIAGLVKGASQGEGLGNKFLSNIADTSAIAHVVRCFADDNVIHVHGKVDPVSDIETINAELMLADLERVKKNIDTQAKKTKGNAKDEVKKLEWLKRLEAALEQGKAVRQVEMDDEEQDWLKTYNFITAKKVIYVANVSEDNLGKPNALVDEVFKYAQSQGDLAMVLSAQIEAELAQLSDEEKHDYLNSLGVPESGLENLSKTCFKLLGLQTYLTTGQKETRAWTIRVGDKAPQAAGVIHTDFEKGFIRANIVSYDSFVANQGWKTAKEKGQVRQEGKDYVMQDGDVVEFLFNV